MSGQNSIENTMFQNISSYFTDVFSSVKTNVSSAYSTYTPELIQNAFTWTSYYLPHAESSLAGFLVTQGAVELTEVKANKLRAFAKLGAGSAIAAYVYAGSEKSEQVSTFSQVFLISALAQALWFVAKHSSTLQHRNRGPLSKEGGKVVYYLIPLTEDQKDRVSKQIEKLHNRAGQIEKRMENTFKSLFNRTV